MPQVRLLEQHGAGGLTMNQLASKVGFATASLYNYFQDKDELLQFCYARLIEPCLQALKETASAELAMPQKLETIIHTALEHVAKHKVLIRLLAGMDYDSEIRKQSRPRFCKSLRTVFEQGIKEGSLGPHDPTHAGRMLLGCLSELFDMQAGGASDEDVSRFAETLVGATLKGFFIPAERVLNRATQARIRQSNKLTGQSSQGWDSIHIQKNRTAGQDSQYLPNP